MTAPRRYAARAEAVRVSGEALRRKAAGESVAAIYDDLVARGETSMALRTFQKWMKRFELGESFVPLSAEPQRSQPQANNGAGGAIVGASDPETPRPRPETPSTFRHARLGVRASPMPNLVPDIKALLGDDE